MLLFQIITIIDVAESFLREIIHREGIEIYGMFTLTETEK